MKNEVYEWGQLSPDWSLNENWASKFCWSQANYAKFISIQGFYEFGARNFSRSDKTNPELPWFLHEMDFIDKPPQEMMGVKLDQISYY